MAVSGLDLLTVWHITGFWEAAHPKEECLESKYFKRTRQMLQGFFWPCPSNLIVSVLFPLTAFNTVTIANSDSRAGKSDSIASWRVEGSCCRRARRMGDTSLANFGKYNLPQTPCCLVHICSPHSFVYFVWMFLLLLYWIPPYFFFLSIAAPWHMKVVGLRVE